MNILAVLILVMVLLGYIFPKSKLVFCLQNIITVIIIGGYDGNIDLNSYRYTYYNQITYDDFFNGVYNYFERLFFNLGCTFETYHLFLTTISILLIAVVILKITRRPALVMSLMTGFVYLEYAVQIKNLIAAAIITLALYYFYKWMYNKNCKATDYVIFILLMVIALQIHFISIFFLLFLLLKIKNKELLKKIIVIGAFAITISLPFVMGFALRYIYDLNTYIGTGLSGTSMMFHIIWQILCLIIVYKIKNINYINKAEEDERYDQFVYYGTWLIMIVLPFYSITSVINRILRIWLVFVYSQIANVNNKKEYVYNISKIGGIAYSVGSFVIFYIIVPMMNSGKSNVLIDVMTHNYFIG